MELLVYQMAISTLEIGKMEKRMVKELLNGLMVVSIQVIGKTITIVVMENYYIQMETFI